MAYSVFSKNIIPFSSLNREFHVTYPVVSFSRAILSGSGLKITFVKS